MQMAFPLGAFEDLLWVRERLRGYLGDPGTPRLRTPVGQLVKSIISSRTLDETSRAASVRLEAHFGNWAKLAAAPESEIQRIISDVTFPDVKAGYLHETMRAIAGYQQDLDLSFLARLSVPDALAWLERLPGVGRKVAASTLNFSSLGMASFVIDTHILRILRRFGFVRRKAQIVSAYDTMMEAAPGWSAAEFAELHMLMKRLGQIICKSGRSECENCPIEQRCKTAANARR